MNIVLALDSATENCSAALYCPQGYFERSSCEKQQHAAALLRMTEELMTESGLKVSAVQGVIYGQGPGSFTGVRVAVSAAQGIALGLNLPLTGVSSLQALACGAFKRVPQARFALSAIDARMGEVYLGLYVKAGPELTDLKTLTPEAVLSPDKAAEKARTFIGEGGLAAAGTGIALLQKAGLNCPEPSVLFPEASAVMALGLAQFKRGEIVDAAQAQPVYIRNEVTWKKLSEQGAK